MIYLWFNPNLVDPESTYRPLAAWSPETGIIWAPGEPDAGGSPALADILADVEALLDLGVKFDATGQGTGNVQAGRPFTREDIAPGFARLQERVSRGCGGFRWERHGQSWALYVGRGSNRHGLNILTVLDRTDAWDACGDDVRALIAAALNWRRTA